MANIANILLGATAGELVDKINEIIAAINAIQPVTSYEDLEDKPSINGVPLSGNKSTGQLLIALSGATDYASLLSTLATKQYADGASAAAVSAAEKAVEAELSGKLDADISKINEVRSLSEDDYITIVTSDGLRKVKIGSLSDNVAVRTVSTSVLEKTVQQNLEAMTITGAQNGENTGFTVSKYYLMGTSNLFLNGQRLVSGTDYREEAGGFTMLTHQPIASDSLIFTAVGK